MVTQHNRKSAQQTMALLCEEKSKTIAANPVLQAQARTQGLESLARKQAKQKHILGQTNTLWANDQDLGQSRE